MSIGLMEIRNQTDILDSSHDSHTDGQYETMTKELISTTIRIECGSTLARTQPTLSDAITGFSYRPRLEYIEYRSSLVADGR